MKVGLFINTQFPPGDNIAARVPELVEQVRVARQSGFRSVLFPHHYLTDPLQMLQITPLMAYLLPETKGMTVGGNILLLPLLNPVHVAEEAATLDVLSEGNFILGVGLGYREGEFEAFGVSLRERAARFTESVVLMRQLWSGEKTTFHGKFYRVTDHAISHKPYRAGGPPVWVAGLVEAAVKRAARIGDAWLIANATTMGATRPLMEVYR
jgi:alkanesulfonate monooxygenase SsuD/methylene tetrahydromethanopterin reductase-like flavin-dependent oxidoreductase (luciferase family)